MSRQLLIRLYPWWVVVLAMLLLFYKYLLQVFPSVITDELMHDFQLSGKGLGNLAACFFYSYLIMQFFSGYLIDRFGLRIVVFISVIISASGTLLFAQTDTFSMAVVGRTLMGIGAAFATVGYMKVAAVYFPPRRFALVGGLLTVGVMLGALFGQAPLALLIQVIGWQSALIKVALIGFLISGLFVVFVHSRPRHHIAGQQVFKRICYTDIKQLLTKRSNWLLMGYSGLAFAPLAVFGGLWGVPFIIKTYGLTHPDAALHVSIAYIGFGLGGPLFGYLADRFGNRLHYMFAGLLLSLFALVLIVYLTPSLMVLSGCLLVFGIGTGAFMLGFAVGKDNNPIHITATIVAFINSADAICGALSEPLIGWVLDQQSHTHTTATHFSVVSYQVAFAILIVELCLAYGFLYLVKKTTCNFNSKPLYNQHRVISE